MKNNIFLLLMPVLATCLGPKALPEEETLFPSRFKEKWWIINAVSQEENGERIHRTALISLAPRAGAMYAAIFSTAWHSANGQVYKGIQVSEAPAVRLSKRFPIRLSIPDADTNAGNWLFKLTDREISLQTWLRDHGRKIQGEKLVWPFENIRPFQLQPLTQNPPVFVLPLLSSADTEIHLGVFENASSLLELSKSGRVVWLDFQWNESTSASMLLFCPDSGPVQVISSTQGVNIDVEVETVWESIRSGKIYPSEFLIKMPDNNPPLRIYAETEDQEIYAGKNSLWMGAVRILNARSQAIAGYGHLIIL